MTEPTIQPEELRAVVERCVQETPVLDIHTHIYPEAFGALSLRGVDELIRYHYLIAEACRANPSVTPESFYALGASAQAEHIWKALFLDRSPVSEACRGVLTALSAFGLDVARRDLGGYESFFASLSAADHISRVFDLARVSHVVMTNDPFDAAERAVWLEGFERDPRFLPALRVDRLMGTPESVAESLAGAGCAVASLGDLGDATRQFLDEWADRMDPVYLAMSLPSDYTFPEPSPRGRMMAECIVPFCRDRGLPLALMIGVKRQVNPQLGLAGDAVGRCSVDALEALCAQHPDVRFLATLLSRENQHEFCVSARKFPNLMPFGCWWFLNNPSIIEEMTLERLELLGLSFIPQHSDARVLDQLVYKWAHSRAVIADVLCRKYDLTLSTGWGLTETEIRRDVGMLLRDNFIGFSKVGDRVG